MDDKIRARVQARTEKPDGESGCWLWGGGVNGRGYPQIRIGGRVELVHRLMYADHFGECPEGQEIRRWCKVLRCVNPNHCRPQAKDANSPLAVTDAHYHVWLPRIRPKRRHPETQTMDKVGKAYRNRAAATAAVGYYTERKPRKNQRGEVIAGIGGRWQGSFLAPQILECLDPACLEHRARRVAAGLPEYDPAVMDEYQRRRGWSTVPRRGAGKRARQVAAERAAKAANEIPSP